jgi:opacity protein-like surface antigen
MPRPERRAMCTKGIAQMITVSPRKIVIGSALAAAALTVTAVDALAGGDVAYGSGHARHRAETAVPVPAPAPVPDYASGYYLRLDFAYGLGDVSKYRSTDPAADAVRADSYLDSFPRYGFGLGYYFNRWLRADVTFDQRQDVESRGRRERTYNVPNAVPLPAQMRDTVSESLTSGNSTGMVNVYADMDTGHRFTPYVGFGLGYVRHQVKGHRYSSSTVCEGAVAPATGACDATTDALLRNNVNTVGGTDYALALALMAGASFNVTSNLKLDMGYRWLNLQGTTFTGRNIANVHNLTIPDQNIHELRVGVRYDIN